MTKRKTPVIESVLYSYTAQTMTSTVSSKLSFTISILSPLHEFLNGMLLVP